MLSKYKSMLILAAFFALTYIGCKSSDIYNKGNGGDEVVQSTSDTLSNSGQTSVLKMTIKWPTSGINKTEYEKTAEDLPTSGDEGFLPDAKSLPDATQSIRITVTGDAISTPVIVVINRTEGASEESFNIDIPVGINNFQIEAFDSPDASGNLIAADSVIQNIIPDAANYLVFTLTAATMRIEVLPDSVITDIGGVHQFKATAFDADEEIILGKGFVWSTGNNSICEVDSDGLVFAKGEGECEVTASSDDISGSAIMSISPFAVGPSDVTLIPGDESIEIKWNGVISAQSYNIYWSTTPDVTKDNGNLLSNIEDTGFVHEGLTNGIKYYYVITSANDAGEGDISDEFSAIPGNVFVYVANKGSNDITIYNIDMATGKLSYTGNAETKDSPSSLVTDPTGRYLYMITDMSNLVSIYSIDSETGYLELIEDVTTKYIPSSITTDLTGRYLYITNKWANKISIYSINSMSGELSPLGDIITGKYPSSIVIDPSGSHIYVTNKWSMTISMYSIDPANDELTLLGEVIAGDKPFSMDIDPSGKFLYAADIGSGEISIYNIDSITGKLSLAGKIVSGEHPLSLAVDNKGRYLYAANMKSDTISIYSIDSISGKLTLSGEVIADAATPSATGGDPSFIEAGESSAEAPLKPSFIAIDPTGRYLYVTNKGSGDISMYKIDKETGGLTLSGSIESGDEPVSMTIYTIGREIHIGNSIDIEFVIR
ncbi:MAG: beta-propeller fold lactonase family protein [Nitrospirota bacterium]